ncbi:general transcription factor iih subunit 4 [Plakobranchus ocellatus]|uniref:General transcription factor IIH subunit 4 n=1 Tax=Plakobranchus ocellatus TaxID=259542 RepID=A0AAV4A031_9GAST|nr:general transcription factor iih subunit 4 [Plakobranchus ocellatus]
MAGLTYKKLVCKDLHTYLRSLTPSVLDKLYCHPATCLAVYRDLPELARHYVMRILFVEQAVAQAVVKQWSNTSPEEQVEAAAALMELRVWYEQPLPGGMPGWLLNPTFRKNLSTALLGGGTPWLGTKDLTPDKYAKDIPFLDKYALERWECVLHFMVGSNEGSDGVNKDITDILLHSHLMRVDDGEPSITAEGFQFLLMDTSSQVWFFLLQYLDTVQTRGMDLVECLTFLFQLSFSSLGKDYSAEEMNENQLRFLQHLREFGLVYQRKRKSHRYYPTRLAINIVSGVSKDATGAKLDTHRPGFIVVETNYRVYSYTDSPLQVALLGLFCEMLYRFPNLAVANLTRASVRAAMSRGITAEQILHFLVSHAHPEMLKNNPVLPASITDQIKLWEMERDRIRFTDGVMYNQFLSQADFELLRNYAKDTDVLVWEMPEKRVIIVTKAGHDDVKKFWKRQRAS